MAFHEFIKTNIFPKVEPHGQGRGLVFTPRGCKYLVTSSQAGRYRLEEIDIAGLNPFRQSQLALTPA